MSDYNRDFARSIPADRADMSVDVGLRSFMLGVYNKVALGLVLSAVLAFLTSSFQPISSLLYTVSNGRVGYTLWGTIIAFAPVHIPVDHVLRPPPCGSQRVLPPQRLENDVRPASKPLIKFVDRVLERPPLHRQVTRRRDKDLDGPRCCCHRRQCTGSARS